MKRIIIICLFLFLSGCTVNYELEFEDNLVKENFNVSVKSNQMCGNQLCLNYINNYANSEIPVNYNNNLINENNVYNKDIINDGNDYTLKLNYEYKEQNSLSYSFLANNLFESIYITDKSIQAYDIKDIFKNYLYLDRIVIGIKTDKVVSNTNCDEIVNDKYYWYIDKENYKYKSISVNFDVNELSKKKDKIIQDGYITGNVLKYVLYILGLFVIITTIYIFIKYKKSSR